jgi:hypothetical protein
MDFKPFYAFAFLFLLAFTACDNEPLEGEFITDDPTLLIPEFKADIEGFTFIGDVAAAQTVQGVTTITGTRSNGDVIVLKLNGAGVGAFDMVNQGEATFGINVSPQAFSSRNQGGSGQVVVTQYDTQLEVISGTFSFRATRPLLDANGQPILDGNGNPTFDEVVITEGEFTNIALDSDGSTGGDAPTEFYADVDGLPFIAGNDTAGAVFIEATNTLVIQGNNNDRIIQIHIINPELGTYDLGAASSTETRASYTINGQDPYSTLISEGGSGTVTLTALDFENNSVSGTFSFVAGRNDGAETVSIENGFFNNLNIGAGLPGDDDFLIAFIDGVSFSADDITIITTDIIAIQGVKTSSGEAIFFTFPTDLATGTYSLTFNGEINGEYFDGETTYGSQTGLLVLLENSAEFIRFAFNFQTAEMQGGEIIHVISEGSFQFAL